MRSPTRFATASTPRATSDLALVYKLSLDLPYMVSGMRSPKNVR